MVSDILNANPQIKIGTLETKTIPHKINCTGVIAIPPTELLSVHSKSAGFIEMMKYIPGDYVKKGAILFGIANPELLEKQRLFMEAKAELALALKDYERKRTLKAEDATTEKAFDEALGRKELMEAKYKGFKNELKLIGIDVNALENEQKFQSKIYVHASKSGYVSEVYVNQGQMIQPSDKLMDIANNGHIHLELQILSKDVPLVATGQKVNFTLPNNPRIFSAEIVKINPVLNEETGTLNAHCHIQIDDCKQTIPGMFVNAEIEVEAQKVKGLPLDAVVKEGEEYFVYIVEGNSFTKQLLENPHVLNNFITFEDIGFQKLVVAGAYYVQ